MKKGGAIDGDRERPGLMMQKGFEGRPKVSRKSVFYRAGHGGTDIARDTSRHGIDAVAATAIGPLNLQGVHGKGGRLIAAPGFVGNAPSTS